MQIIQVENRLEVTEINKNIVTKKYYEIVSEEGRKLIKENNFVIDPDFEDI